MSTGQAVVSLQIQLGSAGGALQALATQLRQIAAAQQALLGARSGSAPALVAPVQTAANALAAAVTQGAQAVQAASRQAAQSVQAVASTSAINPRTGQPYYSGGAQAGYSWANDPSNPANMNRMVQSQYTGNRRTGGTSSGAAQANAQNLQAQAFDVFTQLGSGASPMLVIIQQGPQVIQALGGVGAVLDMVKAKMAALGLSVAGVMAILGTMAAALAVGAVAYRVYAVEAQRVIDLRQFEAESAKALLPLERQLADAKLGARIATEGLSRAEGDRLKVQERAGRMVEDFAAAQKAQKLEIRQAIADTEKWAWAQKQLAFAVANATFWLRAALDSTIDFSESGLKKHTADVEAMFDSVTNWSGSMQDGQAKLKSLAEDEKRAADIAKEWAASTNTASAASSQHATALAAEREAAAALAVAASDAALALSHMVNAALAGDGMNEVTRLTVEYSQKVGALQKQANAAGVDLEGEYGAALKTLAVEYEAALFAAQEFAPALRSQSVHATDAAAAVDRLKVPLTEQQMQALATADAVVQLTRAYQGGASGSESFGAGLEAATSKVKASAQEVTNTVIGAFSDPLAAIASTHWIAGAVVGGIQAAADLPGTLNSLTRLFSDAAAGLTIGGPAISKFIGDLFGSVLPAMVEAADDFVVGIVENIPAIIEGLAAGIPRLAVAFIELFSPLMAARLAVSLARALFSPETWINAGKALGQGFLDAVAALWETIRDLIEAILPGRQFGGERTGLFKGGGIFDDLEYYTAGAVFGRGDKTGLFQSDGWLSNTFGRRNRGNTTNVYQGGVLVIGSDAPRAIQTAQSRYTSVYGGP